LTLYGLNFSSVSYINYSISYVNVFLVVHHSTDLFHLPTLMHNFYSLTICMLHYNPWHVSSINMQSILLSSGVLYSRLQRVTIPDAVIIKFVLLKMRMLMRETYRGL